MSNTVDTHKNKPVGNTKKCLRARFWFFTWNNYPDGAAQLLESTLMPISVRYRFQAEVGKEGTPHLQGSIELKKKMRWTEFKLPKGIHWERTRNIEAAMDYCMKSETAIGERYIYPRPIDTHVLWCSWQVWLYDFMKSKPDNRSIYWLWSPQGKLGKTQFVRYCVGQQQALFCTGGARRDIENLAYHSDFDMYTTMFFSIPRNGVKAVSYTAFETLKDGMVCNMKSHTNAPRIFNPPHVIVFANEPPDTAALSSDRWRIIRLGPPVLTDQSR